MRNRKQSFRYANIGLGVGILILLLGVLFLRGAGEGALQAVALVGLFSSIAVYLALDERAERARRKRDQGSQ